MDFIDLRSDTVTKPTPEMREAMAKAEVGDDVFGEDPTINRLQEMAAEKMGMQAGLFVPSGTMGNLLAVLATCQRGDEVIMGDRGHTNLFEVGGISALGGIFPHTLVNQADGTIAPADIENAVRPNDIHQPTSRLLILENTHNRCGGVVLSKEYMDKAADLAHKKGLAIHIDGARIFNASAALNLDANELVKKADSVTFCLSKGLCCPVGSVLCGSPDFINSARKYRKMLGGGMRQAGILAAAGLLALEKMTVRLHEDHQRAKRLAQGLSQIPGTIFDLGMPESNMVFLSLAPDLGLSASKVAKKMLEKGIKIGVTGSQSFRMVTHYWITDDAVERTIESFRTILAR